MGVPESNKITIIFAVIIKSTWHAQCMKFLSRQGFFFLTHKARARTFSRTGAVTEEAQNRGAWWTGPRPHYCTISASKLTDPGLTNHPFIWYFLCFFHHSVGLFSTCHIRFDGLNNSGLCFCERVSSGWLPFFSVAASISHHLNKTKQDGSWCGRLIWPQSYSTWSQGGLQIAIRTKFTRKKPTNWDAPAFSFLFFSILSYDVSCAVCRWLIASFLSVPCN